MLLVTPFVVWAQDVGVTRVTDDVIVLHPSSVRDMTSVREVGGNVTVVRTDGGMVVTDSFFSSKAGRNGRAVIEARFPNVPIRYLVNTHHHADHVGGNPCFDGAVIVAHVNLESVGCRQKRPE